MKLYDVPRNTKVRIIQSEGPPPDGLSVADNEIIDFKHIDGMYSYCKNSQGEVVHLKAWTEVELV
jgi:hypothetical protein